MKKWILTLTPVLVVAAVAAVLLTGRPANATTPLAGLQVTVTKSPTCSCCGDYIAILRERGVKVSVVDIEDIATAKRALGVPPTTWSCHTTEIAGYVVEGHVPLEAIEILLNQRPAITGIGLPGMPAGSPGMAGVKTAPFAVLAFDANGIRPFGDF